MPQARQCLTCGTLISVNASRCTACERQRQRVRNAQPDRLSKYDAEHRRQRAAWALLVDTGGVRCARCREYIAPTQKWHLDHLISGNRYPSHEGCNTSASRGGRGEV